MLVIVLVLSGINKVEVEVEESKHCKPQKHVAQAASCVEHFPYWNGVLAEPLKDLRLDLFLK